MKVNPYHTNATSYANEIMEDALGAEYTLRA